MSIQGDLIKVGLLTDYETYKQIDFNGFIPLVLKLDCVDHACNNTSADGTSYTIPAKMMRKGRALRISAWGVSVGANAAKVVTLYLDDGTVATITFPTAMVGNWYVQFVVGELTDLAHQRIGGIGICGTNAGATGGYAAEYTTDTTTFTLNATTTVKLRFTTSNSGDTITQKMGLVEFLPCA